MCGMQADVRGSTASLDEYTLPMGARIEFCEFNPAETYK
jgi:hypothetical protein